MEQLSQNKQLTPLEAFQLFCKELKIENSEFANAIKSALERNEYLERENFELMERVGFNATYKDEKEEVKILTPKMQRTLLCTLEVNYGNDMSDSRCKKILDEIVQACEKHNLQYTISKKERYCCTDYQIIKINAQTSVYDVFKIIKDMDLNVTIYICRDGSIIASYDNTYC